MSQLYFKEEKYDSALAYSKDAFYTLPDVNAHRHSYFTVLNHLKDSIELVLTNKSIKSEMEERGYSYAHENFNGTKCAEKVLEVYSKLIF